MYEKISYSPNSVIEYNKNEFETEGVNEKIVLNAYKDIISSIEKYSKIPQEAKDETEWKIHQALSEFITPEESLKGKANSAFLIYSRRSPDNIDELDFDTSIELDDIGLILPALSRQYGTDTNIENMVDNLWNSLPPFEVGKTKGIMQNGTEIDMSLISVPLTPAKLHEASSPRERMSYARPRINDATKLAERFGAQTVGLGEGLGSLTYHGKHLETQFPDLKIATGHAFTSHYILRWADVAAENIGKESGEIPITVIGANGSIGKSITHFLAEKGIKNFNLHETRVENVSQLKNDLEQLYPGINIRTTEGNGEGLSEACRNAEIIVSAPSVTQPFISEEHLNEGTWIIDDSQPPSVTRSAADRAGCKLVWPLGKLPTGISRSFPYGDITEEAEFGCAMETIVMQSVNNPSLDLNSELSTVGAVDWEKIKESSRLAEELNLELPRAQSFGKTYSSLT